MQYEGKHAPTAVVDNVQASSKSAVAKVTVELTEEQKRNNEYATRIDTCIKEIQKERKSAEQENTIKLLETLKSHSNLKIHDRLSRTAGAIVDSGGDGKHVDTNAKVVPVVNATSNLDHMYLLSQGHAGALIKDLTSKETTREDLVAKIDSKIELLKQSRDQNYYFNATSRRLAIEKSISALQKFKTIMQKPGYDFEKSFESKFQVRSKTGYAHLFAHENAFLREIQALYDQIPESKRDIDMMQLSLPAKAVPASAPPSKNAGAGAPVFFKSETKSAVVSAPADPAKKKLLDAIEVREEQLRDSWFHTRTVKTKLHLLGRLKVHLRGTMSLDQAIERIKKHHPSTHYLLFEGRTGKMMKAFEYAQASQTDMVHKIELEILRLQEQRTETVYFWAQSRKKLLEQKILALHAVKAIVGRDGENFDIKDLGATHHAVLKEHEPALLENLSLWKTEHQRFNHRRLV
jgi:hypothetical protein